MPSELQHVYCYQIGSGNCFKVGRTKRSPQKRMRGQATGSPVKPEFYKAVPTENASGLEAYIHHLLDARRTGNGEFFHVTRQELDDAVDKALTLMNERWPFVREADKLRRRKPTDTMIDPSREMLEIYRQLRKANREKFLLERHIEFLQSKVQVAIGGNRGMKGVASWEWASRWTMETELFKKDHKALFEKYKHDSGSRRFCLERVDLTEGEMSLEESASVGI